MPIYWIACPVLDEGHLRAKDELAQEISERQRWDWRDLIFEDLMSPACRRELHVLSTQIERARRNVLRVVEAAEPLAVGGNMAGRTASAKPDPYGNASPTQAMVPVLSEWLKQMLHSATDVDLMLLAGYYAQLRSAYQCFGTGEANAFLIEQGIKVPNPSQCVKQNLVAKRVFRHQRRYRVSQTGLDHLRQLLGLISDS